MAELFGTESYSPNEIAAPVEAVGVTKARLPLVSMSALGILAGGFLENLVPVTTGNLVVGAVMVALVCWIIYHKGGVASTKRPQNRTDGAASGDDVN